MLQQAFGNECLSYSQVKKWHKAFREGREEVTDEPRSGRPSSARTDVNVQRVREFLNTDRRLSLYQVAEALDLSETTVQRIVTEDLHMRKVCAKLVPRVLTEEQKQNRVLRCEELLQVCEGDPDFLEKVITGDETWTFQYDPETKRQSAEWHTANSPCPKKAQMSKSKTKTMLIAFFGVKGIVHYEFVPPCQTVNAAYYQEVLKRLKRSVARKRRDIKDSWKLHHDNAPSHTAYIVTDYLVRVNVPVVPQPPYSPDLSPPDFFLFPRLKSALKGKRFDSIEDIQANVKAALAEIPEQDFRVAFESWKSRLQKCIDAGGAYFEDY